MWSGVVLMSVMFIDTCAMPYSSNWGNFGMAGNSIYHSRPWQLSLALELEFGRAVTNLPVSLSVGAYGDIGKLYQNCFGLTLKVSYSSSPR